VGSFLNPIGPLPPSVYWRRRIFLIGIPLATVLLFAYSCSGGSSVLPASQGAGTRPTVAPTTPSIITPGPGPTGSLPPAPAYPGVGPTAPVTSTAAAATGSAGATGGPGGAGSVGCVLTVVVHLDKSGQGGPAVYAADQDPSFSVVLNNVGSANCRFDLSGKGIVITVTPMGSTTGVWSSAACATSADLRVLGPSEGYTETVRWRRERAVDSCPSPQPTVNAGSYAVTAAVGGVTAASVQFVLR
jgi:hypothetical protein